MPIKLATGGLIILHFAMSASFSHFFKLIKNWWQCYRTSSRPTEYRCKFCTEKAAENERKRKTARYNREKM